MGLFSKSTRDKDFAVDAAEPPLVTATPVPAYDAASSLPTPAAAANAAQFAKSAPPAANNVRTSAPPLGRHPPSFRQCSHCGAANITTRTSTYPSWETWLLCLGILVLFWPACWVPLVVDSAKRTDHVCTQCHAVVGSVGPMADCCVKDRY